MLLSVIIPCYNEEVVVRETYRRLTDVVKQTGIDYELVFINDGSKDDTLSLLYALSKEDPLVKIINFSRNFGHQCAVTAGLKYCKGDLAVIIDADLQDPPEVIPEMLTILHDESANVVYGVRNRREGERWLKLFTAKHYYRVLNRLSDVAFPVDTGDFRLVDRTVIDAFNQLHEKNKYVRGLFSWVGYKQLPCYYDRKERFAGDSKYSLRQMTRFAVAGLTGFSKRPLKAAGWIGGISVAISILGAIALFIYKIVHPEISVMLALIALLIVFFGGLILCAIGILSEYVSLLVDEAKDRPEYIIANTVNL